MQEVHQGNLQAVVRKLFPGANILTNVRKEARFVDPSSGHYFELDLWLPDLKLSFEFQDSYHYTTTWYNHVPLDVLREKDKRKNKEVENRGETLITVPCWWPGDEESLIASIRTRRPDLLPSRPITCDEISLIPPTGYFKAGKIPHVGELMLASFPVTVSFASTVNAQNPWWMGEKYDGIRCCWNATNKKLYTRNGLHLVIPDVLQKNFPADTFLDAEIWYGRGLFPEAQRLIQSASYPLNLEYLRVVTFDEPGPSLNSTPFEARYELIFRAIERIHPFIVIAPRVKCAHRKHLSKSLESIIDDSGEGVIMRRPKSTYDHGRSSSLMKLKAARGDKEALVMEVEEDGSCLLSLPDGVTFTVDAESVKVTPWPVRGDIVTFAYQNYAKHKVPIQPSITRVRTDIEWKDVVTAHIEERPKSQQLNETSQQVVDFAPKTYGYWAHAKRKQMRAFFEAIARKRKFDPLIPENWYKVSASYVKELKGARSLLKHYEGSFIKALMYLFPDIGIESSKFEFLPQNYWKEVDKRRDLFDAIAESMNFDPLIAENWYPYNGEDMTYRGARSVLRFYYASNLSKALKHLYPDIGIDEKRFSALPSNYWDVEENRRDFFLSFATKHKFDPLIADNWYKFSNQDIMKVKGASGLLAHYNGGFSRTLVHIFPTVNFDLSKFANIPRKYWFVQENRRRVLIDWAKSRDFDPLIASNWYSVSGSTFKATCVHARAMLEYHHESFSEAVLQLLPEIGLDPMQFSNSRRLMKSKEIHRKAFDQYAKSAGFDPLDPENWYNCTKESAMKSKVMSSVLNNYYKKERFGDVLQVLYPEVTFHQRKFPLTKNYWQHEDNRRNFFIEYAEANHFDPLVPSNWYRITKRDVTGFRGAAGALSYYGNSVRKALLDLFPNIGFVEAKFRLFAGDHDLRDENKQRSWFINFAKEKGFDPLIPNHWYHVKRSDFSNSQEAQALLVIYKYSLPKALMHLFPDIGLIKENFSTFQKGYWEDKENQKRAFIEHAKIHNFDSSNISNWLTTSNKSRFLKTKAGAAILDLYEKDWDTALRSIFPAQWMEKSETPNKIGHFVLVDNRKQFFMNFAAKKSFDPYVLTNWTPAMVREVKREKRASTVLAYYHGTVGKAIEQLFTDRPTESVS